MKKYTGWRARIAKFFWPNPFVFWRPSYMVEMPWGTVYIWHDKAELLDYIAGDGAHG